MLEKALRYVVLAGIFALPLVCLIVTTSLFFPYITGKNFTFRIIVEIISGAWLALALVNVKYRPRRSWILGCFAIFVLVMAVADAQGVMPFKSFWSNYERMDGWITLIHLLGYTTVAVAVLNTEKLWRRLFQATLAISVAVAIYGFFQIAGTLAIGAGGGGGLSARIDATFGNPIYLAVYMLFHIFMAALLMSYAWRERGPGERVPFVIMYGAAIVLDTAALFFTGTRGTMLGLIGGAVLAVIIYALVAGSSRIRIIAVSSVCLVVIIGAGLHFARNASFIRNVGFLDRLASISLSDDTINARFLNMGIAWQGVKEKPILGWGQENYAIVFDKYYDPRMYGQEPWFDRVHDVIFDWWIAGGTLGLLAYLSIFGAALWAIWRSRAFSVAEASILTGLLAGYFVHNLTVFDNVTSYILFGTMLAYISWRASEARGSKPVIATKLLPEGSLPFVVVICALLMGGIVWWANVGALAENQALIAAIQPQSSGVLTNLADFKQAISYGTYGTQEAREQLAQIATQVASASNVDISTKQQFFDAATSEMSLQQKASSLDARFPLFQGILLSSYGDYKDAGAALTQAHDLSPRKQSILFAIAQNDEAQGDTTDALSTLATAYNLDTEDNDARFYYAAAAIVAGQQSLADQLLAPLIPSGGAADPRISAAYVSVKRYDKIIEIWQAYVKANPTNTQGYFTLAAAYYENGNSAEAISVLQSAEAAVPSVKSQADSLIQQIQSGTVQVGQ